VNVSCIAAALVDFFEFFFWTSDYWRRIIIIIIMVPTGDATGWGTGGVTGAGLFPVLRYWIQFATMLDFCMGVKLLKHSSSV
jgi:hypothetical protein